jgi:hypothetical protein
MGCSLQLKMIKSAFDRCVDDVGDGPCYASDVNLKLQVLQAHPQLHHMRQTNEWKEEV